MPEKRTTDIQYTIPYVLFLLKKKGKKKEGEETTLSFYFFRKTYKNARSFKRSSK
jgi:hypothetical protein